MTVINTLIKSYLHYHMYITLLYGIWHVMTVMMSLPVALYAISFASSARYPLCVCMCVLMCVCMCVYVIVCVCDSVCVYVLMFMC
jgi:hypothetical protein